MEQPDNAYDAKTNAGPAAATPGWGIALQAALCEQCDWRYLAPIGDLPQVCPHCFAAKLIKLDQGVSQMPYTRPPEMVLPFTLNSQDLAGSVHHFAAGIPFVPKDLAPENLRKRLQRLYLPVWLVDAEVGATWQAEAGFDYQVVSHQDRYDDNRGGWSSEEVKEGRIRWEPRLGQLNRRYDNIAAAALEEYASIQSVLGNYQVSSAGIYNPQSLSGAMVRLPDRKPQDAWQPAALAFQSAAADECRQACSADHLRGFSWRPNYAGQNWTLLLQPLYSTYYLDDDQKPQAVLIQGQSGRIHGVRRASLKRAQRTALIILLVAVALFIVSALLAVASALLPVLLVIGVIGLAISLIVGLGALWPILTVWWFNRQQKGAARSI